jgi:hypothetical protein
MRRVVIGSMLLLLGLSVAGCGGSKKAASSGSDECSPPASTVSAGNAQISAKAVGKGTDKVVVVRATDKESGAPVEHAHVTIQGEMTCYRGRPHFMPFIERTLHETSNGTYKGNYNLIMRGQWTISIVLKAQNGDATTSALPVTQTVGG